MPGKDVRDMTLRELGELAAQIRSAPAGSRKLRKLADQMCAASFVLEDSGALGQMMWWAKSTAKMEAPPDGKAEVISMPRPWLTMIQGGVRCD